MSSSLIFVLWIAWLVGLAVVAILRHHAVRSERRQTRDARPKHEAAARQSMSPDYRAQLVAAGIIRPATAPESTPDLQIGSDPASTM